MEEYSPTDDDLKTQSFKAFSDIRETKRKFTSNTHNSEHNIGYNTPSLRKKTRTRRHSDSIANCHTTLRNIENNPGDLGKLAFTAEKPIIDSIEDFEEIGRLNIKFESNKEIFIIF